MKWWKILKFLLAVALLPFVWTSFYFGLKLLGEVVDPGRIPWLGVLYFSCGVSLYAFLYHAAPRPVRLYVFGHELTHALATWLSLGKVSEFKVGKKGGHVVTSKTSPFIVLAPYFVPIYPLFVGLLWVLTLWLAPGAMAYKGAFLFIWGITWGFHICFTITAMRQEQTDFSTQGYFFSFVIIFLVNWWQAVLLLAAGVGGLPGLEHLEHLFQLASRDYLFIWEWMVSVVFLESPWKFFED